MYFPPIAVITRPGRVDNVFMRRQDMQADFPSDAEVQVIGVGGVVIASKQSGPTALTVSEGINLSDHFSDEVNPMVMPQ